MYLCNLACVKRPSQCVVINDATPSYIDDTSTLLDLAESVIVEHALHPNSSLYSWHSKVKLCIEEVSIIATHRLQNQSRSLGAQHVQHEALP